MDKVHRCRAEPFEAAVYRLTAENKTEFRAHFHAKLTIDDRVSRVDFPLDLGVSFINMKWMPYTFI